MGFHIFVVIVIVISRELEREAQIVEEYIVQLNLLLLVNRIYLQAKMRKIKNQMTSLSFRVGLQLATTLFLNLVTSKTEQLNCF